MEKNEQNCEYELINQLNTSLKCPLSLSSTSFINHSSSLHNPYNGPPALLYILLINVLCCSPSLLLIYSMSQNFKSLIRQNPLYRVQEKKRLMLTKLEFFSAKTRRLHLLIIFLLFHCFPPLFFLLYCNIIDN